MATEILYIASYKSLEDAIAAAVDIRSMDLAESVEIRDGDGNVVRVVEEI